MASVNTEWQVLRHRPIDKLESNLWCVTGSLKGMALRRVMSLVRLNDGRLVIHSAIALDEESMREIEQWGEPSVLLVPNAYHRLDAPCYVARYPGLEVYCPRGSRPKVEQVVRVDGDYESFRGDESITLHHLEGVAKSEGALVVRSPSGTTLILNDAVFNMPDGQGLWGWIFRNITQSTGGPRVSRLYRWLAIKDRQAFARHIEQLAETPDLIRVIVSHHRPITDRPAEALRAVAASLR